MLVWSASSTSFTSEVTVYLPNLVEVRVVKNQEELVLILQPLNGVGNTLGEVPNVAKVERLDLVSAELVHDGNTDGAGVDKAPLGDTVPVKLADATFVEVLLRGRDVVTLRQVLDHLLAEPTAVEQSDFGVRKAPLEVRDDAIVSGLAAEIILVVNIDLLVSTAWNRGVSSRIHHIKNQASLRHTEQRSALSSAVVGLSFVKLGACPAVEGSAQGRVEKGQGGELKRELHDGSP